MRSGATRLGYLSPVEFGSKVRLAYPLSINPAAAQDNSSGFGLLSFHCSMLES